MSTIRFNNKKDVSKYLLTKGIDTTNWTTEKWLELNKGQAEIHMMELSESMYDEYYASKPVLLKEEEWHIPYQELFTEEDYEYYLGDKGQSHKELCANLGYDEDISDNLIVGDYKWSEKHQVWMTKNMIDFSKKDFDIWKVKASTGLCARTSYLTVGDDKSPSIETLISIHDKMAEAVPFHASPFEHCARVMTDDEYYLYSRGKDGSATHEHGWCRNYKAFIQYRELIETK